MFKVCLRGIALGFLIALSVGFFWSDNVFLDKVISQEKFSSPADVFAFLLRHKSPADASDPVISGQSLVEMMSRDNGRLWCDEGAIILAAINHRMGYESRLVDFIDEQGVSKHTVLQVNFRNTWITYDFTSKKSDVDPKSLVDFQATLRVRTYPNPGHKILMSNYFIRRVFQVIRPLLRYK